MLTTHAKADQTAAPVRPLQLDPARPPAHPSHNRSVYYLVGEHERSSAKPTATEAGRTLVCVNGRWHGFRGTVATFEQIIALVHPDLHRPDMLSTVTFRRGPLTRPQGSLSPGDVVPIVDGMLVNANVTVLS